MSKIAFKIVSGYDSKYLTPIRKYTNLGLSDIKSKIVSQDLLAESDDNDIDSMEKLKELINHLVKLGAKIKIFDSDVFGNGDFNYQEISLQEFNNSIIQLKEIMEELQDYDDALIDE